MLLTGTRLASYITGLPSSLHYDPVLALFDLPKTEVVGHVIGNDGGEGETTGILGSFNDWNIANSRKIWTI